MIRIYIRYIVSVSDFREELAASTAGDFVKRNIFDDAPFYIIRYLECPRHADEHEDRPGADFWTI